MCVHACVRACMYVCVSHYCTTHKYKTIAGKNNIQYKLDKDEIINNCNLTFGTTHFPNVQTLMHSQVYTHQQGLDKINYDLRF